MEKSPIINIVGICCRKEDETRFNKWYNETHVPMLLKFKGMKGASRHKIISESADYPTYLAVYHFDSMEDYEAFLKSPERAAAQEEMRSTWPGGLDIKLRLQYELIKRWEQT